MYTLNVYELHYSTKTGIVQADIEIYFDDSPMNFKKNVLRAKGKSLEWWR